MTSSVHSAGRGLTPLNQPEPWPFETWPYNAAYLPKGTSVPIVTPPGCLDEPLVFVTGRSRPVEGEQRGTPLHRGARRTLTGVKIYRPGPRLEAVPELATKLRKLRQRVVDLLPILRDHVYHSEFAGSFSLKSVLPALVPGFGYDDLEIQEGGTASALLEALLLHGETFDAAETAALRSKLLAYCKRDTLAMVKLWERLGTLA